VTRIKETLKEVKKGVFIEQVKETTYTHVSIVSDDTRWSDGSTALERAA
jgi:hypothetical protein